MIEVKKAEEILAFLFPSVIASTLRYLLLRTAVFSTSSTRGQCHIESSLHTHLRLFLPINGAGFLAPTVLERLIQKNT